MPKKTNVKPGAKSSSRQSSVRASTSRKSSGASPAKNKGGRPSKYTPALVSAICERLSKGEPLAQICRDEGMPNPSTVWDWETAKEGVSQLIARAREAGFHAIAARMRMTARGKGDEFGGDSSGDVQRDKLIIDTDLKLLSKWSPRLYGDRMTLAGDPEAPLQIAQVDPSKLSDVALRELLNARRPEAD